MRSCVVERMDNTVGSGRVRRVCKRESGEIKEERERVSEGERKRVGESLTIKNRMIACWCNKVVFIIY